jgi:hypothetical protein
VRTRLCAVGVLAALVLWARPVSAQMLGMPTPMPPQDHVGPQPLSELPPPPLPGSPDQIPPQLNWIPPEPAAPAVAPVWPLAPPPGWFLSLDAAFLRPSVWADDFTDDFGPLNPQLRRTFAPTGTVGYRFNNGSAVLLSYRYLAASATTVFPPSPPSPGGEGPPPFPSGPVQTRFASNWLDLDYRSPYLGGWHNFRFQWQAGLRGAQLFYQEYQAASSFQFVGVGPHAGAEVSWWLGQSGLAVYARGDLGVLAGQTMALPWCGDAAVIHAIWDWRGEVGLRYVVPTQPWLCFSGGYQGESFGWGPIQRNFTPTGPFARFEIAF